MARRLPWSSQSHPPKQTHEESHSTACSAGKPANSRHRRQSCRFIRTFEKSSAQPMPNWRQTSMRMKPLSLATRRIRLNPGLSRSTRRFKGKRDWRKCVRPPLPVNLMRSRSSMSACRRAGMGSKRSREFGRNFPICRWSFAPPIRITLGTKFPRSIGNTDQMLVLKKPFDNVEVLQMAHALARKMAAHPDCSSTDGRP